MTPRRFVNGYCTRRYVDSYKLRFGGAFRLHLQSLRSLRTSSCTD